MISNPDNFVCPETWSKNREILKTHISYSDELPMILWDGIDRRNTRLTTLAPEVQHPLQQRIIDILDKSLFTLFRPEVMDICWQLDDDKTTLIHAILDWSTSCYRPGSAKVFIGARIIRSWRKAGAEATSAILSFLDLSACEFGRSKPSFYHLVSELARSNDFCIPTYIQWLISRGGIHDHSGLAPDGPCGTRLLAELPMHDLSGEMVGLRRTLLCRAEYPIEVEDTKMAASISIMSSVLRMAPVASERRSPRVDVGAKKIEDLESLNRASKSHIGLWLRREMELQALPSNTALNEWDILPAAREASVLTTATFGAVRDYLEIIEDFSMLADVIRVATASTDPQIVASCADTLNVHVEVFAAIESIQGLFEFLLSRARSFADDRDVMPRVIVASLLDLSLRIPENHNITAHLARQLAFSDRKAVADACSPVSDYMVGASQDNGAEFIDEIEKLLANGTSIDRGTMERLFQRVVYHLSFSWDKSPEQQRKCVLLMATLRDFNAQSFDLLMASWLPHIQKLEHRPSMIKIFGPLLGLGCLSLKDLVTTCLKTNQTESKGTQKVNIIVSMELLALLASPVIIPEVLTSDESYRIRILQARMQIDNPELTLMAIRSAIEACSATPHDMPSIARLAFDILSGLTMHNLLQTLILNDGEMTGKLLMDPLSSISTDQQTPKLLTSIIDQLLLPKSHNEASNLSVSDALKFANYLNRPFCQFKVAFTFRSRKSSQPSSLNVVSPQLDDLNRAIESAIMGGGTTWACIVPSLDVTAIQHLRRNAEAQFLTLFHAAKASGYNDFLEEEQQLIKAKNLLLILDLTLDRIRTEKVGAPYNLPGRFSDIMTSLHGASQYIANTQHSTSKIIFLTKWLPLLLSFTTSQAVVLEQSKTGHELRGRAMLFLTTILMELYILNSNTKTQNLPLQQCFDLILSMVDVLPDDIRQQCSRNIREASSNPIISYIYSITAAPCDWLYIYQGGFLKNAVAGRNGNNTNADHGKEPVRQLFPFTMKRWEMLGEPTPNMGENDTSLSLTLFASRKGVS